MICFTCPCERSEVLWKRTSYEFRRFQPFASICDTSVHSYGQFTAFKHASVIRSPEWDFVDAPNLRIWMFLEQLFFGVSLKLEFEIFQKLSYIMIFGSSFVSLDWSNPIYSNEMENAQKNLARKWKDKRNKSRTEIKKPERMRSISRWDRTKRVNKSCFIDKIEKKFRLLLKSKIIITSVRLLRNQIDTIFIEIEVKLIPFIILPQRNRD